jgi:hypothetical protein
MELSLKTYTSPYCRTTLDVINHTLFNAIKPQYPELFVHPDCPEAVLDFIKDRLDYTVPKLASIYPDNPCMIWLGAKDKDGYARHSVPNNLKRYGGNYAGLHRYIYAWLVHGGKLPTRDANGNKLEVHHQCGNRACCNVEHLILIPAEANKSIGNPQKLHMGA